MRINDFKNFLVQTHETGVTVMGESAPGVGKSEIIENENPAGVAALLSLKYRQPTGLITQQGSTIEAGDIGGFLYPATDPRDPDGMRVSMWAMPPILPHWRHFEKCGGSYVVFVDGKRVDSFDGVPEIGIVFLDELRQASLDVQKAFADVMLNRRIRGIPMPRGWRVLAASNRMQDRSGVSRELKFLTNRINIQTIENTLDDWKQYAYKVGLHPISISYAASAPQVIFASEVPEKDGPYPSPRSLVRATQMITALSENGKTFNPDHPLAFQSASGDLGSGAAAEFIAWARMAADAVDYETIVDNPAKAPVPDRPDVLLAVCTMLAARVSLDDCDSVLKYIGRLPKEYQTSTIRDAGTRDSNVVSSKEFGKWMAKNMDLANTVLSRN